MELEESGKYTFEEIVEKMEEFRDKMQTFFVLDNLDFLKKNGRFKIQESVQLLPNKDGTDGFFICKMKRKC